MLYENNKFAQKSDLELDEKQQQKSNNFFFVSIMIDTLNIWFLIEYAKKLENLKAKTITIIIILTLIITDKSK